VDPDGRKVKGAGFIRNIFHTDGYCVAYLAAKARGIPEDHIRKINKENYTFSVMIGDDLWAGTSKLNYYYGVEIIHIYVKDTPFRTNWSGIELYNTDNERDRPGADRKTNGDAPLTDITNFPTGTGSSGAENIPELVGNMVGLFERGGNIGELFLKYQEESKQKQKNKEKEDKYNNETIFYDVYINKNGRGYTIVGSCARKDSASTVQKIKKDNE